MVEDFTSAISNQQSAIVNPIIWQPANLPAGVYILQAKAGAMRYSKRVVFSR
jgi:hypothetical protein